MINGLDMLTLTKLDILTGIDSLKIAVAYKIDGKKTDTITTDVQKLAKVKVIYKNLPGWKEDITKVREFHNLPSTAQNYIKFIEKFTKLPVKLIGVGPNRHEIIKKGTVHY